jgi:hypothetical protein
MTQDGKPNGLLSDRAKENLPELSSPAAGAEVGGTSSVANFAVFIALGRARVPRPTRSHQPTFPPSKRGPDRFGDEVSSWCKG